MLLPTNNALDLPIREYLPQVLAALQHHGTAILVSPPGTGKTTLVPLALADVLDGRILVAQPRRVAARAAAHRMASLIGESVGQSVGYSVRGESKRGRNTRVEVVTTGLLVRRLQHDPELAGVAAVILDECHERSLDTDLALAFAVDVRANLRPDLHLVAMSATTHAESIARTLGGSLPAPIVEADGGIHPLDIRWCAPPSSIVPAQGTKVDPALLLHVATVTRHALSETQGDVLVFLPGLYEINSVATLLNIRGVEVQRLHGAMSAAEQDYVLSPSSTRRVILASAIAESSLTVPGVRVVVDAGLSRVIRADLSRGLSALVTLRESKASSIQRAGRAGREGPGRVYRCWAESDQEFLPAYPDPEIAVADLTAFALEMACWGNPGGLGLALVDQPPTAATDLAGSVLGWLGAIDDRGRATAKGRALNSVGLHPRLARAMMDGSPLTGHRRAAEVVAILSTDARAGNSSDDLVSQWRGLRAGNPPAQARQWREEVERLFRSSRSSSLHEYPSHDQQSNQPSLPTPQPELSDELAAGLVVGLAFPERIARLRPTPADAKQENRTYLMAGGTAAELATGTQLAGASWLAIATADRPPGHRQARIRSAVTIDEETAVSAAATLLSFEKVVRWDTGDVRSVEYEKLGAITLVQRPLPHPPPDALAAAVQDGLRLEGMGLFRWGAAATELRARMAACHVGLDGWPAVDDATLLSTLNVSAARSRADLQRVDLLAALRALLSWQQAATLEQVVPERIRVPSGSEIRVDYSDPVAPTLSVRVQEVFGWTNVPTIAGRPLRLNLLTPAGRTAAITSDLTSFWVTGYPGLRAELRGRYPRHPWPADPATGSPTRRANERR